ncbi:trimeric intracellular cation channel family protein [Sulfobacillus thermosulfidooxidans]|uniref:trimeric intracellular cation channel family protein n=1 Tax=Sulfobacillus thermosulfidooxidans TaxID=28034 RepID=UPI00041CC2A5|nr:trimeric intracellular cation channel family protein [Sulfobacillus thermosulfidooxidans]OLZ08135.1 hypothetical protein BFX05_05010 [Sulfobacillus thermosulfidooxidans]OLZ15005.1 hypothetical protein BFX06_05240 [Sulfobacillus thermosulfidooxidans]OLZ19636.1 hypothetical protein BFX07_02970 [Sulfobacillus thermosulfidooxidans]
MWDILNILGTMAFAISGALVAIEENYDIFGIFVLSFITAFGGGAIRNLLIGLPLQLLWSQSALFKTALLTTLVILLLPTIWLKRWPLILIFFDAVGLGAYAIEGALYAVSAHHGLATVIVAATLTGIGGGMLRDVLAGRKPFVLQHDEYYAIWTILGGMAIGLKWVQSPVQLYILLGSIVSLRMISVIFHWRVPHHLFTQWSRHKSHSPTP